MLIRVSDTFEVRLQPERGTVLLRVQAEGSEKSEVTGAATAALADLTQKVHQLLNPGSGPITAFNQGQVSNSAHRPWHERGKQLPFIYTTTCTMSARFNDFGALFRFIEEVATLPDVEVQGVNWELTKRTEELAQADAQTEVVRRVTEKAMRLASAAGATEIVPTIIADPGLLTERGSGGGFVENYPMAVGARTMMAMDAGGGSGLVFQPEEIVIRAAIEAEYEAS